MFARVLGCVAAALFVMSLQVAPVHAQATRTWVSGVGDDVNPCSRTAPCKTFAGAISKTASGGQISVLDPGGFGTITITKAISIVADGDYGSILASGGINGVTISNLIPAGARVYLRGLDIDGAGTTLGLNGVRVAGAARVFLEDVRIRNFSGAGVLAEGPAGTRVVLKSVTITQTNNGVDLPGASPNSVVVYSSTIDNNLNTAVNVGVAGTVVLNASTLNGSGAATDLTVAPGGTATSYGNNLIRTGTPTNTLAPK